MTNLVFIQANDGVGTGLASQTVAYSLNTTSHSYLLAWMWTNGDSVASITDTLGNVWTQISSIVSGGTTIQLFQVAQNKTGGGANTITVHYTSGTSSFATIIAAEYTGQYTAGAVLDAVNPVTSSNSPNTTLGARAVSTHYTNETVLFFAIAAGGLTIVGTGGYTAEFDDSGNGNVLVDGPATAAGTYAPTGTVTPGGGVFGITYSIRSSSSHVPSPTHAGSGTSVITSAPSYTPIVFAHHGVRTNKTVIGS